MGWRSRVTEDESGVFVGVLRHSDWCYLERGFLHWDGGVFVGVVSWQ